LQRLRSLTVPACLDMLVVRLGEKGGRKKKGRKKNFKGNKNREKERKKKKKRGKKKKNSDGRQGYSLFFLRHGHREKRKKERDEGSGKGKGEKKKGVNSLPYSFLLLGGEKSRAGGKKKKKKTAEAFTFLQSFPAERGRGGRGEPSVKEKKRGTRSSLIPFHSR